VEQVATTVAQRKPVLRLEIIVPPKAIAQHVTKPFKKSFGIKSKFNAAKQYTTAFANKFPYAVTKLSSTHTTVMSATHLASPVTKLATGQSTTHLASPVTKLATAQFAARFASLATKPVTAQSTTQFANHTTTLVTAMSATPFASHITKPAIEKFAAPGIVQKRKPATEIHVTPSANQSQKQNTSTAVAEAGKQSPKQFQDLSLTNVFVTLAHTSGMNAVAAANTNQVAVVLSKYNAPAALSAAKSGALRLSRKKFAAHVTSRK